jgi:DNA-binding transcriptional MerR regulator
MDIETRHSIADLARLTGVTPRTVRYYVAQGLLPGANDAGPGAWYDERHLARLRLIRRLQAQHLPLAEIRTRLDELSDDEVGELGSAEATETTQPQTSALDYIRGVLGTPPRSTPPPRPAAVLPVERPLPRPLASPPRAKRLMLARLREPIGGMGIHPPGIDSDAADAVQESRPMRGSLEPPVAPPPAPPPATTSTRSQWDRIGLTPDIELHVRRPLSRLDNRRVERLITIARQLLKEDQP